MLTVFASLLGILAIGLGAFGTHGLESRFTEAEAGWWATASHYLLAHAVAVLALAVSGKAGTARAGWVMGVGALIFAATLYAMALGAPPWFGAVTPVGGLGMMAGWLLVALVALEAR